MLAQNLVVLHELELALALFLLIALVATRVVSDMTTLGAL